MVDKAINPLITEEDIGQRIDNFLIKKFSFLPKTLLYRMIRKGEIRVNSKRIGPFYRLNQGDHLRLPPKLLNQPTSNKSVPAHISKHQGKQLLQSVIYENDDLIILNKPAGLAVHAGSSVAFGLIEILKCACSQWPGLELVHRLDKDTSGCIMLAKSRKSLVCLHTLMREGNIDKQYYALVKGSWSHGKVVELPLARRSGKFSERLVHVDAHGERALTHFTVMKRFPNATLLRASPITGRTHQIRVHAAYMGHPIIGDVKYGCHRTNAILKQHGLERLCLHACSLEIPLARDKIKVVAPLPDKFQAVLKHFEQ